MICFIRAVDRHPEVIGLLPGEGGELDAQAAQVQSGNFLVQLLGQGVHLGLQVFGGQFDLGQALV